MHLFYTPDLAGDSYKLNEEESRHCTKVLRLTPGDTIHLTDGKGGLFTASITDVSEKRCEVVIVEKKTEYGKRNFFLHIAVAPTKNIDRIEWFLEKATEIGIDEITPLLCKRSERDVVKTERLNKVITSAVKQSLKAYYPKLNEITRLKDLLNMPFDGKKYIAHCGQTSKMPLKNAVSKNGKVMILIGPEGDFTNDEIVLAVSKGFEPISLGNSRLRTETAALVACHTINLINEL